MPARIDPDTLDDGYLSLDDVAELVHRSPDAVGRWCAAFGAPFATRKGARYRWRVHPAAAGYLAWLLRQAPQMPMAERRQRLHAMLNVPRGCCRILRCDRRGSR
jgi:hypothetical protein